MKRILLLATGGTIASKNSEEGLRPAITSDEIIRYVPVIRELCEIDTLQLMNIDSTNMKPEHWLTIVVAIENAYDDYDGFVITHGTDTMAYTAAALSYLIQDSPKPVVITGSQKSICYNDTDARRNLYQGFLYAVSNQACDVSIVFDGKVILGTRARKERTKSFNAFSSVDYPDIAAIRDSKVIQYLTCNTLQKQMKPRLFHSLESRILVVTLIPGLDVKFLSQLKDDYNAIIFQSFGVGGVPGGATGEIAEVIREWNDAGNVVLMMTQVSYEGSDMQVYQVGKQVKDQYQLLEAYSMTLEAAATKLMWILGQTKDPAEIRELFYTPIRNDIIF